MFPPPLHLWFKKKRKRNEERERESDGHSWGGPQPKRARLCALGCVVCLSAYSEEEAEAPRGVHACETASAGVHALPCEARVKATTVFSLIYDPHLCPGCQFV